MSPTARVSRRIPLLASADATVAPSPGRCSTIRTGGSLERTDIPRHTARLEEARLCDRVAGGFLSIGEHHHARAVACGQQVGGETKSAGEIGATRIHCWK